MNGRNDGDSPMDRLNIVGQPFERGHHHGDPMEPEARMSDAMQQRIVPFHGDELIAVQRPDGNIFVHFGRLCDNLGLARSPQVRRAQRHEVLNKGLVTLTVETEGGAQSAQCLRIDLLPLWMAGLHASRVKAELRDKLVHYQEEAAVILWQAFKPQILVDQRAVEPVDDQVIKQLQQIVELGYAIARMGEQQIELQRQQRALSGRVDTAARVIRDVQLRLDTMDIRLGDVEDLVRPEEAITDAQATEVSHQVKALAELLTGKDSSRNHYQGIFAELYRRFGVSSYKLIPQAKYPAVLSFLDDWRSSTVNSRSSGDNGS